MTHLVAYDIAADSVRAKVAALLSRYGVRVQRSVFSCEMDRSTIDETVTRIAEMIDLETDSVLAVPQCSDCQAGTHRRGQIVADRSPTCWIV